MCCQGSTRTYTFTTWRLTVNNWQGKLRYSWLGLVSSRTPHMCTGLDLLSAKLILAVTWIFQNLVSGLVLLKDFALKVVKSKYILLMSIILGLEATKEEQYKIKSLNFKGWGDGYKGGSLSADDFIKIIKAISESGLKNSLEHFRYVDQF